MMKNYICKLAAGSLLLLAATFTACEDELTITTGNTDKFETLDGTYGSVRSAAGARQGTTITLKNGQDGMGHLYFELSEPATTDVTVTFAASDEALAAYNADNGTSYEMYPGLTLANGGTVTIAAGEKKSAGVELNIPADNATVGKTYAAAIAATADNGVKVSANTQAYVYLVNNAGNLPNPADKGRVRNLAYIEVNDENPLNAGEYLVDGVPFFDVVSIFAANINLDADGRPYIYCNDKVSYVLAHADQIIRPLQQKGIKVHLSILGNHNDAGMRSLSAEGAQAFAKELKAYADIYGLDGFDFDDEYSSYAEGSYKGTSAGVVPSVGECTPQNYLALLQECRKLMPKEDGLAFGIYWYTEVDHPLGSGLEDVIDYTVFGSYGAFHEYYGQTIDPAIQAPYAINLTNGVPVNGTNLQQVVNGQYGYFAFYNLKTSAMTQYMDGFNHVAQALWGKSVEWTGRYYGREDLTPSEAALDYEDFLGTWTVTSGNSLFAYYDETGAFRWWDWKGAQTFSVTISEDVPGQSYLVSGWDGLQQAAEHPFVMTYNGYGSASVASPQYLDDARTWGMGVATYSGLEWVGPYEYTYSVGMGLDGTTISLANPGDSYGFSLFQVDGDAWTSVIAPSEAHPSGAYTLVKE